MNATEIRARSLPPIQLSQLRAATRRATAEREHREAEAMREAKAALVKVIQPKSPAEKHVESASRTLRDMPFNAACRTVKRMNAKLDAQKYPREQRAAAEKLLNIISR